MSFEDYQEVVLDEDDNTFTIVRNNGKVHTYNIDAERDLLLRILEHEDEVDIYVLSSESVDKYGMRYYEKY